MKKRQSYTLCIRDASTQKEIVDTINELLDRVTSIEIKTCLARRKRGKGKKR